MKHLILLTCLGLLSAHAAPPNVVFLVSDDHAWNDYGFMGHEHIQTPRLDRLAAESLVFTRATTHVPLCRPSLSTMLTGLYPHQHGVTGNDPVLPVKGINPGAGRLHPTYAPLYQKIIANFSSKPNLVRDLTKAGYRTLQTGKWWEGSPINDAGFTHAMTHGYEKGDRHGGAGLVIGREGLKPITDFLDDGAGQPFFIWYAPLLPHDPHTPPQRLLDKYLPLAPSEPVARYWACVEWFDETCGALIDELQSRHLLANTIIVYTCDNGWIQDPATPDRFAPRSKLTPYEGGVRTPIFFHWKGHIEPRMDREHLAGNIDLWPTLASLLNRETPAGLPGIDLTDAPAVAQRQAVFGGSYAHSIADVEQPTQSLQHRYLINGWHKLIVPVGDGAPELYDLKTDPWEKHNLAAKEPDTVKTLLDKLNAWWTP